MRTVVIVEPHPLFRLGLRQLLSDVLPEASLEGYDYSALGSREGSSTETCDLLLLSVVPGKRVSELAGSAAKRFSPSKILLLADSEALSESMGELPACVAGAVPKEAPPEILQTSVKLVLAGGSCFPASAQRTEPEVATLNSTAPAAVEVAAPSYEPVKWMGAGKPAAVAAATPDTDSSECEFSTPMRPGSAAHRESQLLGLTPRQYEVLVLLARGYPMKKVGRALNISVATAKAHTETLYQRLDVHNRNAAVYAAVSRGATLGWANVAGQSQTASNP